MSGGTTDVRKEFSSFDLSLSFLLFSCTKFYNYFNTIALFLFNPKKLISLLRFVITALL